MTPPITTRTREGSFAALERSLVPALLDQASDDGDRLPPPTGMEAVKRSAPGASLAFAALEMAVADTHLRAEQRSLAALLGVEGQVVEIGAVVGQLATIDALVASVAALVDDGVTRVKMKIGPGWDVDPVAAVVNAAPGLRLQVDANGSYARSDGDHLADLDRFGLLCLEQPLDRDDLEGHARLAGRLTTPICLDESLDSPESPAGHWPWGPVRWSASSPPAWGAWARHSRWWSRAQAPGSRCGWGGCSSPATPAGSTPRWPRCPASPGRVT